MERLERYTIGSKPPSRILKELKYCIPVLVIMPKLEQFEIKKYWQIFSGLTPQDNKVTHDQVLPILLNSKLDSSILNKIWFLADIDDDDNLDFEEFVICMRLIFDMVNHNIDSVPDELPDWLVPGSKANLVAQRKSTKASNDSDKEFSEERNDGPDVEWYISPSDKNLYESLYERCRTTTDGAVSLASLRPVVLSEFSNVTPKELDQVWKLVNARNLPVIDKDPLIYLLHILNQKNDLRAKIPSDVPPALKEVFGKENVATDLNNQQGSIRNGSKGPVTGSQYSSGNSGKKRSVEGGDSVTKGSDWEIVKLQRDLVELDKELADIERQKSEVQKSRPQLLLSQFEGLYRYKKEQLAKPVVTPSSLNVLGLRDDIDSLETQVQVLQQYLDNKQGELRQLQQQVEAFR